MRWPIFSYADGIVRKNENGRLFHQRRKPDAGPHVVTEIKESRAECANSRNRKPVHARAHHVLTHAEVKVASSILASLEVTSAFKLHRGLVRGGQVRRAADQPRNILRQGVQHLPRTLARSHALRISRERWQALVPAVRKFAALHPMQPVSQLWILFRILRKHLRPLRPPVTPAPTNAIPEMFAHAFRHQKLGI